MFTTDAHCDTLYSIGVHGAKPETCAVNWERLQAGNVGIQTYALFAGPKGPAGTPYQDGIKMLDAADQIDTPILRGALPDEPPKTPHGVISIEGGEMIEGSLDRLAELDARVRLRLIALTWNNENEIGHPAKTGPKGGLKPFGLALLREMDKRGIYADVSHLNEAGFWDTCTHANLPPVASHSNCRWLCPVVRNLRKEQVRAIIEKGGFIGANFYTRFLTRKKKSTIEMVFRHIDAICEMGGAKTVGFGSDFDGIETWPENLATPADLPNLIDMMRAHGYRQEVLEDIAGLNYWRLLKRAEAIRAV